ncbi:toxin-antitoxin system YwqK family antitoxin [Gracilimonas sp. Q87]|uniref:toxin-antitoxin system YwqK family antitoxin n=1 Tax=Gracilimonas sp. Q87 TaxID=3384766 RepID=UPI0039842A77
MALIFRSIVYLMLFFIVSSCAEQSNGRSHYFLNGYENLEFRDENGNVVSPREFITSGNTNGARHYMIRDTSLNLVHRRSGDPYSGYIRTFHRHRYNIQAEFDEGKIFRLRYWYPNRTLAMDQNFIEKTMSLWNSTGNLMASANKDEMYYYYSGSQGIKEIIMDTMHSYYDREGQLERYTVRRDSASIHFDSAGTMRRYFPFKAGVGFHGIVKEWHANGHLKVIGEYVNGRQSGDWVEYDSLGNEVKRERYPDRKIGNRTLN